MISYFQILNSFGIRMKWIDVKSWKWSSLLLSHGRFFQINGISYLVQLFLQIHIGNTWSNRCKIHASNVTLVCLELTQGGLVVVFSLQALRQAEKALLLLNNLSSISSIPLLIKHGLVRLQVIDGHLILGHGLECWHLGVADTHVPVCLVRLHFL